MSQEKYEQIHFNKSQKFLSLLNFFEDFNKTIFVNRIRPLNTTEEKTGSKVIVKFPAGSSDDQCISIGVSLIAVGGTWRRF